MMDIDRRRHESESRSILPPRKICNARTVIAAAILTAVLATCPAPSRAREAQAEQSQGEQEQALLNACRKGDIVKLRSLLEQGVDPEAREARSGSLYGNSELEVMDASPIQEAALAGHLDAIRVLVAAGASPSTKGLMDVKPSLSSMRLGSRWNEEEWLGKAATDDREDRYSSYVCGNPLGAAAFGGHLDVVRYLVEEAGIPVDDRELTTQNEENGWTPLMWGAIGGDAKVVGYLLTKGADPAARDEDDFTALHYAVLRNAPDCVGLLLQKGADREARDNRGNTPLHMAAVLRKADVLALLLKEGADPKVRNKEGWTPLHVAAANKSLAACEKLLAAKADPNEKDGQGRTPLHLAAASGASDICLSLLAAGASPTAKTILGDTPLHFAAASGDVSTLLLIHQTGADVNAKDVLGYTPLHYAAWHDREKAAALLILRGASINVAGAEGFTPLHLAALEDAKATVPLLLVMGANPNPQDDDGWTPLHLAAGGLNDSWDGEDLPWSEEVLDKMGEQGKAIRQRVAALQAEIKKRPIYRLIEYGADVRARNYAGETPLHVAAGAVEHSMIGRSAGVQCKALIAAGADVNAVDNKGQTPLDVAFDAINPSVVEMLKKAGGRAGAVVPPEKLNERLFQAIYQEDINLVQSLLDQGADPSAKNLWDETALMDALSRHQVEIAKFLIERGADVKAKRRDGLTALHEAVFEPYPEMVEKLLQSGAEVDAARDDGQTPLIFSCSLGFGDAVKRKQCIALLLGAGADIKAKDKLGRTALHEAAFEGDVEAVKTLLSKGADTEVKDNGGLTPLGAAIAKGNEDIATFLRQSGVTEDGATTGKLIRAVQEGDAKQASLLISQGAGINVRDDRGNSLAALAIGKDGLDMLNQLFMAGADFSGQDGWGRNLISIALNRFQALVPWLLDHGASMKGKDGVPFSLLDTGLPSTEEEAQILLRAGATVDPPQGNTSQLMASAVYPDRVKLLLKLGADPNHKGPGNSTALHSSACGFEGTFSQESVDLLIAAGADVNARNDEGETPAHEAVRFRRRSMLEALAKAGADFSLTDKEGLTPLGLAKRMYDLSTVAWIERRSLIQKLGLPK